MAHKIKTAYDAYWFLLEHPSFSLNERVEIDPAKASEMVEKGFAITKDRGGKCWREFRHVQLKALEMNLDVFYAKVDKRGTVSDDQTKNKYIECWLEFGRLAYDYAWDGDVETHVQHYHDTELDTGAPTFDEALVKLSRLVLKKYGDYDIAKREDDCGSPVCADCAEHADAENEIHKELEVTGDS